MGLWLAFSNPTLEFISPSLVSKCLLRMRALSTNHIVDGWFFFLPHPINHSPLSPSFRHLRQASWSAQLFHFMAWAMSTMLSLLQELGLETHNLSIHEIFRRATHGFLHCISFMAHNPWLHGLSLATNDMISSLLKWLLFIQNRLPKEKS